MGPKYPIIKRPPLELLVAAWLSPVNQKIKVDFTVDVGGKDMLTRAEISGLNKDTVEYTGKPVSVWVVGTRTFPGGRNVFVAQISPHNRNSWLADFGDEAEHIHGNYEGKYLPFMYSADVTNAVRKANELSRELTGFPYFGGEIALAVIHSLSTDMMVRHLNTPAPE